jgi:hypothetical protein
LTSGLISSRALRHLLWARNSRVRCSAATTDGGNPDGELVEMASAIEHQWPDCQKKAKAFCKAFFTQSRDQTHSPGDTSGALMSVICQLKCCYFAGLDPRKINQRSDCVQRDQAPSRTLSCTTQGTCRNLQLSICN